MARIFTCGHCSSYLIYHCDPHKDLLETIEDKIDEGVSQGIRGKVTGALNNFPRFLEHELPIALNELIQGITR